MPIISKLPVSVDWDGELERLLDEREPTPAAVGHESSWAPRRSVVEAVAAFRSWIRS